MTSLVAARIVPEKPTAKQVPALGQLASKSCWVVPEFWLLQVAPPLDVSVIVPLLPTAKQVLASRQLMPKMV